ncbi:hypothetical protein [Evansella halocellulosilytica]|nr:hypothetical protein [Evansella halocellulosilytica]
MQQSEGESINGLLFIITILIFLLLSFGYGRSTIPEDTDRAVLFG